MAVVGALPGYARGGNGSRAAAKEGCGGEGGPRHPQQPVSRPQGKVSGGPVGKGSRSPRGCRGAGGGMDPSVRERLWAAQSRRGKGGPGRGVPPLSKISAIKIAL